MTGKSALARSIADIFANSSITVVSYFISRSTPLSRKTERLVQTLAYQLAKQDTVIRERLLATLTSDPGILQHNINDQMQRLIVDPLIQEHSTGTKQFVVIIDGLDEAEDVQVLLSEVIEPLALVLLGLSQRIKLIVSSREFGALRMSLFRGKLKNFVDVQSLNEIDEPTVRHDMRMFITAGLGRLRERAGLGPAWPTIAQVDVLADRAGSLFIYAATVLQFLGDVRYSPKTQLERLLDSKLCLLAAASGKESPFSQLDALYREVIFSFFGAVPLSLESDLLRRLRLIIAGVIYAVEPVSVRILSDIFGIPITDIRPIVDGLTTIWLVPQDNDQPLCPYHISFSEFICSPTRCTESLLCIPPVIGHELLGTACVRKMERSLDRDICNLIKHGEPLPRIENYSLGMIDQSMGATLQYACLHGLDTHFRQVMACTDPVQWPDEKPVAKLAKFCKQHLLCWVEVRAILGEGSLDALIRTLHQLTRTMPVCGQAQFDFSTCLTLS